MSEGAGGRAALVDSERPLNIVQVVRSDAFAGVERYVSEVSAALATRGHRVSVVGGDAARMTEELPAEVAYTPAATVPGAAVRLVRHRHADLVHVHMTAAEVAAWLVHPVLRSPVVATRHFAASRGSATPARLLAAWSSRSVARDLAISRFVAAHAGGPTVLLQNGVAERPQAPLDAPVVVMLQRLSREKQSDVGLAAWERSGLGPRGWRLVVAGGGECADDLAATAAELGIAESVEFLGRVRDTDALLAKASLLLATAPQEPFGLSVVEAMAHGVPVVAAAGGGHLETVADAGALFAPGDPDAAATALVDLAGSRDRRQAMGRALRDRQQKHFSLSRHVDHLEQVYREVLAERAVARR